jgi:hypothetical protein
MKVSRYLLATLSLGVLLVLSSTSVKAQTFSITVSADENGNGTLTNTAGFNGVLPAALLPDPGPGGLPVALTYGLLSPPGLTAGDLIILDSPGVISDVIRFNPQTNGGSFVYYSLLGGGQLADTGLPSAFYTNAFSVLETDPVTIYTPTSGQPGFVTGAGGPVTYRFTGSQAQTPEPASLILLGSGVAGGIGFLRRRRMAQSK